MAWFFETSHIHKIQKPLKNSLDYLKMAFIFCLSMLTIALLGHIDAAPAGSCSLHNFEESFGELFDFQHNRRYPENQNEMNAFCT